MVNNDLVVGLPELRNSLLNLHKSLVDMERVGYENAIGPIASPNHFLQLLTSDPWFAWLHPLSLLIVALDEAAEQKEPLTMKEIEALFNRARTLLVASETGEGFGKNYFEALQGDPDVVFAHAEVAKLLKAKKGEKRDCSG